jgi:hypothetical protein
MKKLIRWHKLQIGKVQNYLRIDNYETLWLSWFKGIIMGIILMSLLSGCYITSDGSFYSDPNYQTTGYYQPNTLTYYHTHYVPTMGIYYWNNSIYWGYADGWYYYYGYAHMYPWWYYYHYQPAFHYHVNTHVYCHLGHRKYVTRPNGYKRMNNKKDRNYNVEVVNVKGINVKNNSNVPTKFRNNTNIKINTNTQPNRNNIKTNRNNNIINTKPNTNINKNNNKSNRNKSNINRSNSNKSSKPTYNNRTTPRKSNTRKPK